MATEYRELNAVIKAIWSVKISPDAEIFNALKKAIEEEVKNIEPADVRPVRRAINKSEDGFLCSACSFGDFGCLHGYKPNYCPNCGADMRGT